MFLNIHGVALFWLSRKVRFLVWRAHVGALGSPHTRKLVHESAIALSVQVSKHEKKLPNRCSRQNVINRPLERGLFVAGERWNTCRSSSHLDFLTDQDPGLEWRPRGRSPRCALLRGDSWAHEVRWMFCPGHEPMLGYSQHHNWTYNTILYNRTQCHGSGFKGFCFYCFSGSQNIWILTLCFSQSVPCLWDFDFGI